ncbi:MAG TPA: Asp-tRNA(Asn)/Glu-tRNA(Gln) amidotransferase subunit GatC [Desulfobulbaceae bacterium]|nr:Asp-tRNA(Asn)/Glu-tRNA(Gln) amidotransferase subunit GatC [Desulfobulbaceae bacterium]
MKISKEKIERVARLARLDLSGDEVEKMTRQLDTILQYMAKLDELDTTGIEVSTHTLNVVNAFRDDEVRESLPREKALAAGPLQNGEAFIVPKVIK